MFGYLELINEYVEGFYDYEHSQEITWKINTDGDFVDIRNKNRTRYFNVTF